MASCVTSHSVSVSIDFVRSSGFSTFGNNLLKTPVLFDALLRVRSIVFVRLFLEQLQAHYLSRFSFLQQNVKNELCGMLLE